MQEDRRIQYSKMVLRESLLALMKERPINKITVTDLCRQANLNRNTFYMHYHSPVHLLSSIEESFFAVIKELIERSILDDVHVKSSFVEICEHIADNSDLCTILFSDHGNGDYLERVIYILHDRSIEVWKEQMPHMNVNTLESYYSFISSGSAAVVKNWIKHGMKETPQEIAQFIEKVSRWVEHSFVQ
ncbi:TetR family transcriptional regulator C-terminal domain-containing protein [Paenibacillus sp. LS1]|uniref:TetR-like C-terminal domain-containing protein n=1 Tax=Paenibacillus sp. LS1 TaxID=2992120 RepID=UPI0022302878|nr:TetR-like C-terminal domain-containing protein [Paenibacillus sp. LS1]MCW3790317.1 TetR family transcriptional regulator C-terminal domain-containing protein [Paenibacillus sp. LS1]